jgi:hypothetical protein
MISFYKWKKQAIYIMLGVIPLLLFLMIFFATLKSYTIQGMRFIYIDGMNLVISFIVAVVTAIVLMIIGNRWLRHAFTSMLEGKGLLTFILDSTGLIGTFNVRVDSPKMRGILPQKNLADIEDIYDTDLMHRLMVPKDTTMTQAITFEKDDNGDLKFGETVDVIVLPKENEKYEHLFSFENRPVFIFNKVMRKFLSRDALAKYEKDIEIKHNALNILRKVQETDTSFRNFGRYIGENIKPGKRGFLASSLVKYILLAGVIGLIVFIIILFVPGFLNAGANLGP